MNSTKAAPITSPDSEHRYLESKFASGVGHGHQDDIVIVLMGNTGSGRSSFIKLLTSNTVIRDDLKSETSDVQFFRFFDRPSGRNVTIVDTPGFNESRSGITDAGILTITDYLSKEYDEHRKLNAVIYLQRISDPPFGGQSQCDLRMFRELCGLETYRNVVVLTSFWDQVSTNEEGIRLEAQLKSNFFKDLVAGGARFMRHDRTIESARQVLQHISSIPPAATQTQREVRKEVESLVEIAAGSVLGRGLDEARKLRMRLMAEADKVHAQPQQEIQSTDEVEKIVRVAVNIFQLATQALAQTEFHGSARDKFQFAHSDKYPPYLKSIPPENQTSALEIFDVSSLLETKELTIVPPEILSAVWGTELVMKHPSMEAIVNRNRELHAESRPDDWIGAMYARENIGLRKDWYTDAAFGQQQFTGSNPTTITLAPTRWIDEFKAASQTQRRSDVSKLLTNDPGNFFVQDYSDFRSVIGLPPSAELKSGGRYGCCSVALFYLEPEGKLHPLAITLDYKGRIENSVTIFNRRIASTTPGDEAGDWPWRYAKMCAQTSDWLRQEITAHLVNTHLVEEVIIVAAYRTFQPYHIVFQLLKPHWQTTLSLNSQARDVLVPEIITELVGLSATQTYAVIKGAYKNFKWTESYVPNDLRRRGFAIDKLDESKYHNYGYARNIARMWEILRSFVGKVITGAYANDAEVANDKSISAFCDEVRSQNQGQLTSFPDIKTVDGLIDVVTMCIHIAAPQHTAVNYLQQYYQTFVPNKPGALYTQLPQSLAELQKFGERDILSALPIRKPKDWLLMAQVPYLLSFEVSGESNILHYAMATSNSSSTPQIIRNAARVLKDDLEAFADTVAQYSQELDDQQTPYFVLDPSKTAVSILI